MLFYFGLIVNASYVIALRRLQSFPKKANENALQLLQIYLNFAPPKHTLPVASHVRDTEAHCCERQLLRAPRRTDDGAAGPTS